MWRIHFLCGCRHLWKDTWGKKCLKMKTKRQGNEHGLWFLDSTWIVVSLSILIFFCHEFISNQIGDREKAENIQTLFSLYSGEMWQSNQIKSTAQIKSPQKKKKFAFSRKKVQSFHRYEISFARTEAHWKTLKGVSSDGPQSQSHDRLGTKKLVYVWIYYSITYSVVTTAL